MKPKWQRGRVVKDGEDGMPLKGDEVWVKIQAPEFMKSAGREGGSAITEGPCFWVALENNGEQMVCDADFIELLARDENDFAEDVRLVPWTEFLAECRAAKGVKDDAN